MLLPEDEVIDGVQGGRLEFELALVDENGRPVDTTVFDEFKICVFLSSSSALEVSHAANANGSVMTKVGVATSGVFKILINPVDMETLKVKDRQDIDFEMSEAADPTNVVRLQFKDRLNVVKSSCA